jgi:hypothetical protein
MHYLVGSTPTLLMAALLLVVVGSLPALPAITGHLARLRVVVCVGAILAGALGFWLMIRHGSVLPDERPYRVVSQAAGELRKVTAANVVVIDGASYTLNAVKTELLEAELARLGYQVRAVRMAVGAANHFERYQMQESAINRLNGPADPKQNWVYMTEIQIGYDTQPLAQFAPNQDTARTYHYTTFENGWYALRALRSPGVEEPKPDWRWPLFRHTLINTFNVGALQRLTPKDAIEPGATRDTSRTRKSRFKFRGMERVRKAAKKPVPTAAIPSWLFDVREPRSRRLWHDYLDEFVYFGVPSTVPEQMQFISGFCQATPVKCIVPDAELLDALDDETCWSNPGHVSGIGATTYSPWLARALAASGALKK